MLSGAAWTELEVEAAVASYFAMLERELRGERYNKTEYRRALAPLLNGRSDGSIERKHQNISAILLEARFPWVNGYKPLSNYQASLAEAVLGRLEDDAELSRLALQVVDSPSPPTEFDDLLSRATPPPSLLEEARQALSEQSFRRVARRIDYLAREARNHALGAAGEDFVVRFERARLRQAGRDSLASKVEHVASTRGDGLGYDVLSFNESGDEKFLEVKTTQFSAMTPFFVTSSELSFSLEHSASFELYRVFTFRDDPRLFRLPGPIPGSCSMQASEYRALPK